MPYTLGRMAKKYLILIATFLILSIGAMAYLISNRNKEGGMVEGGTGIKGNVLLGPICPAEDPGNPACDHRPYETRLVVTASDQVQIVKEFSSDKQGMFYVALPPGEYAIRSATIADTLPYCSSDTIKVTEGRVASVTVNCDSGLR